MGDHEQPARWQYVAVGALVFRIEPARPDRRAHLWDAGAWKEYPVPAWQIVSLIGARTLDPRELTDLGIRPEEPSDAAP